MAEYLTALVLVQQVKKGATLVFGGGPTTLDMRTTVYSYSAPETMLSLSVRKELGEYLGIPVFNAGGFSDSQLPDQQAALECATSLIYAAMAGGNLIHDVGYLASGMTSSIEMLTICDEQIAQIKRYLKSFALDKESLAVDLIDEVGPGGRFPLHGPHPRQVQGRNLVAHDHRPHHPRELGGSRAARRCATGRGKRRGNFEETTSRSASRTT